jgi:hypothetical protein
VAATARPFDEEEAPMEGSILSMVGGRAAATEERDIVEGSMLTVGRWTAG